ncbi:MAG: hypothetical protein HY047_12715 [Acidobacteria bacterium]|nr:hypothetical protein [Acidobacteriota bacterium]
MLLALPITRITPAFAADLRHVLTDYTLTSWDQKDGLPSGNIWSLAQDADGYLWVGSEAGLFRFDGVRFVPSEMLGSPRLPRAAVRAMCASRQGDVWVGFGGSGGVSHIKNGHIHSYGETDGLPAGPVAMLVEDPSGSMWMGNDHGLYRFAGDRWEKWQLGRGLPAGAVYSGYHDRHGHLLIENEVGIFRQTDQQERFEPLEMFDETTRNAIRGVLPRSISEDAAGDIWMTDPIVGFRKVANRSKLVSSWPDRGRGTRLLHDRAGNLWVSTGGQGLWRVRLQTETQAPIVERATSLTGLLADGVYALLEDRDGNIWAGTTEGLNRLTPRKITQFVDLGLVRGVEVTPDGSVWGGHHRRSRAVRAGE